MGDDGAGKSDLQLPRFTEGTQVVCNTSGGWEAGRVVDVLYRQPDFPPDFCVPYLVQLASGRTIYVPEDIDQLCRLRVPTWWERAHLAPGNVSLSEKLRKAAPESVDELDFRGISALTKCASVAWNGCVRALLELGADPNIVDSNGRSPLHHAVCSSPAAEQEPASASFKIQRDSNAKGGYAFSPDSGCIVSVNEGGAAAQAGMGQEHIGWLITHIDGKEEMGQDFGKMMEATKEPNRLFEMRLQAPEAEGAITDRAQAEEQILDTVRALLDRNANPNAQDKDPEKCPEWNSRSFEEKELHRTALHYCAALDNMSAARALLQAAADPNIIDGQYKTPLHLAIDEQASHEMVQLLLSSRADPNKGNISVGMNSSYLMVACRNGDAELATALINAKAYINLIGKQGITPLHMAARSRKESIVRILIDARADTSIRAMGKTAAEMAMTNGQAEMAVLLGRRDGAKGEGTRKLQASS